MFSFFQTIAETEAEYEKLRQLYVLHRDKMYYAALKIVFNPCDAEDAVHDAFVNVSHHLSSIDDIDSDKTKAYLLVIVKNSAIDILRKRKNGNVSIDDLDESITDYVTAEDSFFIGENENEIHKIISSLGNTSRSILVLKYVNGLELSEISELLNIKYKTASKRLTRAKAELIKKLKEEGIC